MKNYNDVLIKNSKDKGRGVFANKDFKRGELVIHGKGLYKVQSRTNHSFQIKNNTHMQLDKTARSINHSCDPNTGVRTNFCKGYDFVALRNIQKGEEITWDYETTEYISISVKKCLCGSINCRGSLKGFKFIADHQIRKYSDYIADYLKNK